MQAAAHLDTYSQQAFVAQRVQEESSITALQINDALTQLIAITHAEMNNITETAAAVQERLLSHGRQAESWRWWKESCVRWINVLIQGKCYTQSQTCTMLTLMLTVDPGWMSYIVQWPAFSFAARFIDLACFILRFSSSSLTVSPPDFVLIETELIRHICRAYCY